MGKQQSKVNHFCQPLCSGRQVEEDLVKEPSADDDGIIRKLPLFSLTGVVLVPGQTLPLHLFQTSQVSMIRQLDDNDRFFGIVTERFLSPTEGHIKSSFGTMAEVISVEEDSRSSSLRVKGRGTHRFQVIKSQRQLDGTLLAKVRIMNDRELPPLLDGVHLSIQRRQLSHGSFKVNPGKKRKVNRFSAADYTHWPSWVYKQYDAHTLMMNIQKELSACNSTLNDMNQSKDPGEFSFWLMANLPIDDQLKLGLLKLNTVVQRLQYELAILKSCDVLCCKDCRLFIAEKKDVFSMAKEGPLGMYVNPTGYIHEMITVYRADGLKTIGGPSTENTWFDGFAWTVVQCKSCTAHIGWKFTALRRGTKPEKFWGVCRSSVLPGIRRDVPLETDLCYLTL